MRTVPLHLAVVVVAATLVLTPLAIVGTAGPAAAATARPGDVVPAGDGIVVGPVEPDPCPPPEPSGEPAPGTVDEPACEPADPPLPDSAAPPSGGITDPGSGEDPPDGAIGPPPGPEAPGRGPVGGVTEPGTGSNAPLSGPGANAPTNSLAWVGQAIRTRTKSTTAVVEIPAGIPVTGPVAINVRFGGRVVDQDYTAGTGNRILHNYAGGLTRQETVNVRLTDRAAGVSYAMDLKITIEPLFDLTLSSLHFDEFTECDVASEADPEIYWMNPEGNIRTARPLVGDGAAWINEFGHSWSEISVADGLIQPQILWTESDSFFQDGHSFAGPVWGDGEPLLPTETRRVSLLLEEGKGDCSAYFTYTITVQLRWYPNL